MPLIIQREIDAVANITPGHSVHMRSHTLQPMMHAFWSDFTEYALYEEANEFIIAQWTVQNNNVSYTVLLSKGTLWTSSSRVDTAMLAQLAFLCRSSAIFCSHNTRNDSLSLIKSRCVCLFVCLLQPRATPAPTKPQTGDRLPDSQHLALPSLTTQLPWNHAQTQRSRVAPVALWMGCSVYPHHGLTGSFKTLTSVYTILTT